MSDIETKRAYVTSLYDGPKWAKKVREMPDSQVIAIYLRETSKPKTDKPKESGDDIPL